MTAPDPGYLKAADAAGLLHTLDGHRYVAGAHTDPVTGAHQTLIEYADRALIEDPRLLARLRGTDSSPATAMVLRTPADLELPEPWRRQMTYVQLTTVAESAEDEAVDEAVRESDAVGDGLVREWLVRAFQTAGAQTGAPVSREAAALEAAESVLDRPDRVSLLYVLEGKPIGHATLLTDTADEVTGQACSELVDVLVEPGPAQRAALAALTAAAAHRAHAAGLPLVGHVVHAVEDAERDHATHVLNSLGRRGWVPTHCFWRADS
ncbi:hypothetical protein [Streptomyces coffeae]|uniref:GNAT family N-acetyltransferase n=1 Tax=Streptomyces coffeae TaxID=621382 RepID=A0ABS1NDC6_9ACTN|nr:hypothetical protein [Streptomyces coffeae]MBL1097949.1 hypothetical protein [Streptomyces coffeae]